MLPKLYAILDVDIVDARGRDPIRVAEAWLEAGVRLMQLRAKKLAARPFLDLASAIAERAKAAGALFIVNDRIDVAAAASADGVHLGQEDLSPADARLILPASAIVGLSTHNEDQVRAALTQPASYIAIGPVFSTTSKERPDPVVGLEGVRRAVALAGKTPVVAIGGITLETAPEALDAGATSVAVISDLMSGDPGARARTFLQAI